VKLTFEMVGWGGYEQLSAGAGTGRGSRQRQNSGPKGVDERYSETRDGGLGELARCSAVIGWVFWER
jgi:hypothetical protein